MSRQLCTIIYSQLSWKRYYVRLGEADYNEVGSFYRKSWYVR